MLHLIENDSEKQSLQRILIEALQTKAKAIGIHDIGWHGGHAKLPVYLRKNFWFGSKLLAEKGKTPRYWNVFGYCNPKQPDSRTLIISAEINIELRENSKRISGYFARDESGKAWLMHSGRVGGGRSGIGKEAFLGYSFKKTFPVLGINKEIRYGIPVTTVDQSDALQAIERYVSRVRKFKEEATSKPELLKTAKRRYQERIRYIQEATGTRRVKGRSALIYETRHGDIVHALFQEREANRKLNETVLNGLPDLYVTVHGEVTEVYEVKTSCDRQSLYTAIGQLFVHSKGCKSAKKILVLPSGEKIAKDIQTTIGSLGLDVWHFQILGNKIQIKASALSQ